jgi:hypothetical protein
MLILHAVPMPSRLTKKQMSGLGPKLTCIGAKLVETWQHVYISFGRDGYQQVAIRLSTNLRPALSLTLVALQYLPL